ncbi:MAG: GNAT family N-acetyltransferase [Lachnospiraceae bacterium]|nr:GNAT family N-acetyltransferase [Lachnospiraceae bacterium]
MSIFVRKAALSDFSAVRKIMNQVQEMHVAWRPDIYKSNENLVSKERFDWLINNGNLYVADSNGKAVGVLELSNRHIDNPAQVTRDVIFIDSLAVDSDFRGQGIGHLLLQKVKELQASTGADGIELQVNAKNIAAYEMYKKYGFTEKSVTMELL